MRHWNWNGIIREGNNFLKGDGKGGNFGHREERSPKHGTGTRVPNVIILMITRENTTNTLSTKSSPCAPVVGDSANMGKGKSKRFAGTKNIGIDDAGDIIRSNGTLENSFGLKRDEGTKTKGSSLLINKPLENLLLGESRCVKSTILLKEILIGIANNLNGRGITELEIKILQYNVEPIVEFVNLIAFHKDIL